LQNLYSDSYNFHAQMIWIESPTNPLLKLADIKTIIKEVKSTRPDVNVVVDNTFATCYFQVNYLTY
jgi:cystathionine gamma-lyase